METFTNSPHTTVQSKSKKWIIPTLVFALILSSTLNIFFTFSLKKEQQAPPLNIPAKVTNIEPVKTEKSTNVVENTHEVDKEVKNADGTTWIGIKATPTLRHTPSTYELWRIDKQDNTYLIEHFPISVCDSVEWNANEEGGVDVIYMTSPCEAFRVLTHINYNTEGVETFRLAHNSSESTFVFQKSGQPEYEVALLLGGKCENTATLLPNDQHGIPNDQNDQYILPKVILKGVTLTTFQGTKTFSLSKSKEVSCALGYGESVLNPLIEDPTFDEEKITFTLPDGQTATITLGSTEDMKVTYTNLPE